MLLSHVNSAVSAVQGYRSNTPLHCGGVQLSGVKSAVSWSPDL